MKLSLKIFYLFLAVLITAAGVYVFFTKKSTPKSAPSVNNGNITGKTHPACLGDDEIADYPRKNKNIPALTEPSSFPVVISIYDFTSGEKKTQFEIPDLIRNNGYPIELHRCGVYVIKEFNVDYTKSEFLPNFNFSLWKYDYNGNSIMLLTFAERKGEQKIAIYYPPEFRINSTEVYIALIRGSLGRADYAIIIKDLNTLQDAFTLPITEVEKRNPDIVDDIELDGWTRDGRYFWARTHSGANVLGFIRIDTKDWTFEIFPAPKDVLGGDALNIEKGLITVHPGNVWYGIADVTEQEKARRRAQGIGTELYIYNLFTSEKYFIASTTEPLYYFKPKWLSDTELQYNLPSGETKIYRAE